ncbi:MAG: CidA/LrgA family protein [Solobacterium sp.]|nr:CidA/LrgA family protein [Erysipelotrichaceae bacterium]MBQ9153919.1 CidA/LrgA family protein [Solobacterium sp.]
MKYLKQFGIILLITCIGEIIRYLVPLPIPGSIYGLVLMLVLLCTGVLKLESVKSGAEFLIAVMPVMFIPAAAGLIDSWPQLQPIILPTVVILLSTTAIVMGVTGKTAMFLIGKDEKED